jgi:hypothetical protein
VDNPWTSLELDEPPYVLECDKDFVKRYNQRTHDKHRIMDKSIPEPFIGNPETARLVLLNLNPGHGPTDEADHKRPAIKAAMLKNLRWETRDYPFYPYDPIFSGTGVAKWWQPRTRELKLESGLSDQAFSTRLMVIEWFPYHSERFARHKRIYYCPSQEQFTKPFAQWMSQKAALVVGMRSKRLWSEFDPQFGEIPYLNSPQCGYITRHNTTGDLFDKMLKALTG